MRFLLATLFKIDKSSLENNSYCHEFNCNLILKFDYHYKDAYLNSEFSEETDFEYNVVEPIKNNNILDSYKFQSKEEFEYFIKGDRDKVETVVEIEDSTKTFAFTFGNEKKTDDPGFQGSREEERLEDEGNF